MTKTFLPHRFPDADKVNFLQSGTGAVSRTVQSKLRDTVSVKDFNAVGDGVTDDTAAIQSAIDAAETIGGSIVLFPEGTYLISDTITVDDVSVILMGVGAIIEQMFTTDVAPKGSVIKLKDGAFTTASKPIIEFVYQGTNSEARLGSQMRDIVVFGNRSTDTASPENSGTYNNNNTYGIGVQIEGARYVTLERVFCLWCAEDGIKAISGGSQSVSSNNLHVYHCVCVGNGDDGIDVAVGDSVITYNHCGYNGGDGIAIGSSGDYLGNLCWNNFGNGIRASGSKPNVVGGRCYDNKAAGILVSGNLDEVLLSGIACVGNGQDATLTDAERSGVYISGASKGTISGLISGNNSGGTGQKYGLRIQQAAAEIMYSGVQAGTDDNDIALITDLSIFEEKTIATGAITVTKQFHYVDTEADAATDDLDTINGEPPVDFIVLRAINTARTVVVKDGTGNLRLSGDFSMDHTDDTITLIKSGSVWLEISRSDNAI